MRYIVRSAAVAALFLTACDQSNTISGPSAAGRSPVNEAVVSQTNEQDVPWADEQLNPCNGDDVTANATAHIIFHVTSNSSGGYTIQTDVDFRGSGVGVPSLSTYTVKDWFTSKIQTNGTESSWRDERDVMVMAPQKADNYIMHLVFKYTMNANLVPTATFDRTYTKCVG